jgi:riboflavin biosynthesis pyrimidine reductase
VRLELDDQQAEVLRTVLDEVLGELSSEIADTDNASFRISLANRRDVVHGLRAKLDGG